jgi:pimeloyl-ACP methyl ester carboxylesterase
VWIALALALVLLVAVAAASIWRKRTVPAKSIEAVEPALEGVLPIPGPVERGPPLPVVVHGLFGFDRIGAPGAQIEYFRGIVQYLHTLSCHAHVVRLPATASVPERVRSLVCAIDALPHERVDLIAHSLGGLDATYALTHLGLSRRVRSLVTDAAGRHGFVVGRLGDAPPARAVVVAL